MNNCVQNLNYYPRENVEIETTEESIIFKKNQIIVTYKQVGSHYEQSNLDYVANSLMK